MASIDERVVEMRFNREDFLRGTEQTMEALNRLDSTLSGGGGIADGVQQIGSRMGTMGALACTAGTEGMTVELPGSPPEGPWPVVRLEFDGSPEVRE